jgi:hypothetical protein
MLFITWYMNKPWKYYATEMRLTQKHKFIIPFIWGTSNNKINGQSRIVIIWESGEEAIRSYCLIGRISVGNKEHILDMNSGVFHNNVNVLTAIELYTRKWLKCKLYIMIYFTTLKIVWVPSYLKVSQNTQNFH